MRNEGGEQRMDRRSHTTGAYLTVAELAEYLGVSVHVVYRNVASGDWKVSRTSPSPKAPIRVSAAQVAVIEEQMKQYGERDSPPQQTLQRDELAAIAKGMRRRAPRNAR
jgi:transposase